MRQTRLLQMKQKKSWVVTCARSVANPRMRKKSAMMYEAFVPLIMMLTFVDCCNNVLRNVHGTYFDFIAPQHEETLINTH
jgi:hypothetical protein